MHIAILGGGISGLSLAYFLKRLSKSDKIKITLFECQSELGGVIKSVLKDNNGILGTRFDHGPHSIRAVNTKIHSVYYLLNELKCYNDLLVADRNNESHRKRYIIKNDKLIEISSFYDILFGELCEFNNKQIIGMIFKELLKKRNLNIDKSVMEFFKEIYPQTFIDNVINPIMFGIYSVDSSQLSVQYCMKDIYKKSFNRAHILRYICSNKKYIYPNNSQLTQYMLNCDIYKYYNHKDIVMFSLKNGLSQIIDMINNELKNQINIITQCEINKIHIQDNNISLYSSNNSYTNFNHVFSTLPSYTLSKLINHQFHDISLLLNQIKYSSNITVCLEYSINDCQLFKYKGFGALIPIPKNEISSIIGIIFDSNLFGPINLSTKIFTVIFGGPLLQDHLGPISSINKDQLILYAVQYLQRVLSINPNPIRSSVIIYDNSIPIPHVNYISLVNNINSSFNSIPITFAGSASSGSSIPDCIHNSLDISQQFLTKHNIFQI